MKKTNITSRKKNKKSSYKGGPIILVVSSQISTLGDKTSTVITHTEEGELALSFSCDVIVIAGVMVKLKADGTVTPVTAVTDMPLGAVYKGNRTADMRVTVFTPFNVVMRVIADGTVNIGDRVACSGVDSTTGKSKMKVGVYGNWISGQALTGGTTGSVVLVGVYEQPVHSPIGGS